MDVIAGQGVAKDGKIINLAMKAGPTFVDVRTDVHQIDIACQRRGANPFEEQDAVDPNLLVWTVLYENEMVPRVPPSVIAAVPGKALDRGVDALGAVVAVLAVATTRSVKIHRVIAPGNVSLERAILAVRIEPKRRRLRN